MQSSNSSKEEDSCCASTNETAGGDLYGFSSVESCSFDAGLSSSTSTSQYSYQYQRSPLGISNQKQSFKAWMWSKGGPFGGNKRAMSEQGELTSGIGGGGGGGHSVVGGHLWNPPPQYRSGYKRTSAPLVRELQRVKDPLSCCVPHAYNTPFKLFLSFTDGRIAVVDESTENGVDPQDPTILTSPLPDEKVGKNTQTHSTVNLFPPFPLEIETMPNRWQKTTNVPSLRSFMGVLLMEHVIDAIFFLLLYQSTTEPLRCCIPFARRHVSLFLFYVTYEFLFRVLREKHVSLSHQLIALLLDVRDRLQLLGTHRWLNSNNYKNTFD